MSLNKYRLHPISPFVSPVQSDTFAGQLLCAAGEIHGTQKLSELIDLFRREQPPFNISSPFPMDCLPMPFLPGLSRQRVSEMLVTRKNKDLSNFLVELKKFKKKGWLNLKAFERLRNGLSLEALFVDWMGNMDDYPDERQISGFQPHNSIDRRSNTVLEGGLYFNPVTAYESGFGFDIYAEVEDRSFFESCLDHVSKSGYGADSSTGKGAFIWHKVDEFDAGAFLGQGTHKLLLSHAAAMDMSGFSGYYKLMTKYGKVWPGFGESNPFKKPFALFKPGSVFSSLPDKGYILNNIHSNPDIVQITRPFCVAVTLEEGL